MQTLVFGGGGAQALPVEPEVLSTLRKSLPSTSVPDAISARRFSNLEALTVTSSKGYAAGGNS